MFNQWDELKNQISSLQDKVSQPHLDSSERLKYQKQLAFLQDIFRKHELVASITSQLHAAQEHVHQNTDPELASLFEEEITELESRLSQAQKVLIDTMFPPDDRDNSSAFIEIRAGAGGQEAALFAADLLKMYTNYALKNNWKVEIVDLSQTDLKGYKEVIVHIQGKGVYGHLKFESGVHRVQRVPNTETQGRIHTSTATVAVLPEVDDVEVTINPQDLRIDTYRAGGAGGQHVNKTDSAVRITHIPTGVVVSCQDERSQHKNRNKAMKILKSRIYEMQQEKQESEKRESRKEQVGRGMRAEKVRTYNFPQNRVTDHQVGVTLNKLDRVIEGALDEIIDALRTQEREQRLSQSFHISI